MTVADRALELLADRLDPPEWEPRGRPELRPHQRPPAGDWDLWILTGGRGAGKTEAGSQFFCRVMRRNPGWRGLIIAPTYGDAVTACVEGPSGILATDPEVRFVPSAPGGSKLIWPNGSEALVLGTPTPRDCDRLRAAGNRHIFWWEEMAANPQLRAAYDVAFGGLREGARPIQIATTTPKPLAFYRELLARPGTVVTHGTMWDNPGISDEVKQRQIAHYGGTRIGRQELYGELLDDAPGALWQREWILSARASWPAQLPHLVLVVVAIDPAATHGEDADETSIVVAGRGVDRRGYVLADLSCRTSPDDWARRAVAAYDMYRADRVVAEINNGGDMVGALIRAVRPTIPYAEVRATRGKVRRAEPVAMLYEQGRISHAPGLDVLEDQLCTWEPDADWSPDRLDALVWALTALGLTEEPALTFDVGRHVAAGASRPSRDVRVVEGWHMGRRPYIVWVSYRQRGEAAPVVIGEARLEGDPPAIAREVLRRRKELTVQPELAAVAGTPAETRPWIVEYGRHGVGLSPAPRWAEPETMAGRVAALLSRTIEIDGISRPGLVVSEGCPELVASLAQLSWDGEEIAGEEAGPFLALAAALAYVPEPTEEPEALADRLGWQLFPTPAQLDEDAFRGEDESEAFGMFGVTV
jgi:phage terminase large subunit-like protein